MIWPKDRRPTRLAQVLTETTTPPRATAAALVGSAKSWTAAMEATLPTSSVPAVAAKAKVMMRTQKRGVLTISPGVRSPKVPAWAPPLGASKPSGSQPASGAFRNRAEAAIITKKMTPSALRAPKMPRLGMSSEASTGDSTAGPAVEAARVMPEARPFLSMNHF